MKSTASAAACLAAALLSCALSGPSLAQERITVTTPLGGLSGIATQNAEQFLGIPFAQPPVGALRWAPPQPAMGWSGEKDASQSAASCPQNGGSAAIAAAKSEDCLYLNVFRPIGADEGAALPVMVYAYGGGNAGGGAVEQNGARLASETGVIVVVPNYRLGALGFLNLTAFDAGGASAAGGNYGVLDLEAALEWVQGNIAAFNGDPTRVTLASQSSGATNTCRLLVDPDAAGLYAAAILSSDDCVRDVDTIAQSQSRAEKLAEDLGCSGTPDVVACLRAKSADELLTGGGGWNPNATRPARDLIFAGEWNKVPVLLGSTREEGRSAGIAYTGFDADDYERWIERLVSPAYGELVKSAYGLEASGEAYELPYRIGAFITDSGMRGLGGCPNYALARHIAAQAPVFYYQFEDRNPPAWQGPEGYRMLASHGLDVQYLWSAPEDFAAPDAKFSAAQAQLADEMVRYWGAFVRNHDPAVPGQAAWPRLATTDGSMLALRPGGDSQAVAAASFAAQHRCEIWDIVPEILDRGEI